MLCTGRNAHQGLALVDVCWLALLPLLFLLDLTSMVCERPGIGAGDCTATTCTCKAQHNAKIARAMRLTRLYDTLATGRWHAESGNVFASTDPASC